MLLLRLRRRRRKKTRNKKSLLPLLNLDLLRKASLLLEPRLRRMSRDFSSSVEMNILLVI